MKSIYQILEVRRILKPLLWGLIVLASRPSNAQDYRFNRADFSLGASSDDPGGVVAADFNKDGNLDLAVTDQVAATITVLLGQSNGAFLVYSTIAADHFPGCIVVADFNGDGNLDIAVADWLDESVWVYLGDGKGNFGIGIKSEIGSNATIMAAADFNHDGKVDLAVTDNTGSLIAILLGKGDGSFDPYVDYSTPSATVGIVAADFNRDGNIDLAVADTDGNDVVIFLGRGDGTFKTGTSFPAGEVPVELVVGDFNGDGLLDLGVVDGPDCGCGFFSVLVGNGDGSFQSPLTMPTEAQPGRVVAGDFNHDGWLDVAIAVAGVESVYLGNGDGSFKPNIDYGSDFSGGPVASGDFNHDGNLDLALGNFNGNLSTGVSILLGNGDGTFGKTSSYGVGQYPLGIVSSDFDDDRNYDLATVNTGDNTVSVLKNLGNGSFQAAVSYSVSSGQSGAIVSGDFNGDSYSDLATTNFSAGTVSVLLNKRDGSFGSYVDYPACVFPGPVVAGDFNNDGKIDLVVGQTGGGMCLLLGNGNGTFQKPIGFATGLTSASIAVADFNGDGNLDLATVSGSFGSNSVTVLLGNGNGTFQSAVNYAAGGSASAVVASDFNGDQKVDLAVIADGLCVFLGNGDGTFQPYTSYPLPSAPFKLLAGRFSGNPWPDLAVLFGSGPYPYDQVAIAQNDGKGQFGSYSTYYAGLDVRAFATADFDRNGSFDLAVTNNVYSAHNVTVLLNTAVASLSAAALDFAPQPLGTTSAPREAQLSNPGTSVVKISSVSIVGPDSADFLIAPSRICGYVAIAEKCVVEVMFKPTAKGKRVAALRFADNALGKAQTVTLTGTGQ